MDYQLKKLPKSQVELTITVAAEDLDKYRKTAIERLAKEVKIKGFRPGHAPANVVEQHIGEAAIKMETIEVAVQKTYVEAVVKENLQVISRPEVKIEKDEPLTYKATVSVLPEIELKDYKSIKIKKEEPKVTDEDVEKVMEDLQRIGATYTEVERKAKKGDRVEVDFEGFDEGGAALENTKSKNHPVILGEGNLVPGFEDEIVGMEKGQTKEFDIVFPEDYHKKDFQKKKVKFKLTVQMIEESVKPDFDEALIEKLTGKKENVDEFKAKTKENILARKQQEGKQKQENEYIEELLKKVEVDLPESLVHEEIHYIIDDMKANVEAKGLTFDQFLAQSKTTEAELHKKYHAEAEKRIKVRLALQHIIKEENITTTPEETKAEVDKIKGYYKDVPEKELEAQVKNRLALDKLFAKVLS